NRHGNVAPVRATVQPHVMGLDAQRVDGAFRQADPLSSSHLAQCDSALTWHGHAAFSSPLRLPQAAEGFEPVTGLTSSPRAADREDPLLRDGPGPMTEFTVAVLRNP